MQSCRTVRDLLSSTVLLAFLVVFLGTHSSASHQTQPNTNPANQAPDLHLPASANELVHQVIDNELKQRVGDEKYFYVVRKLSPSGEQIKQYVETDEGAVGRLMAINGKALSDAERRKEDQHLEKLVKDPEAKRRHRKEQLDDEEHTTKMMQSMPDAFIYQYDGTEDSPRYGKLVRLQFKPNPGFSPPNHETQICRGMEGTMLIDPAEKRLVRIAGTLTQEVTFGWGIFGHLDKGGRFFVEQSKISTSRWEPTKLDMKFTGRVLLFKKLNIEQQELTSGFRPAPPHLSLSEGVNVLKQQNPELALGQGGSSGASAK